MRQKRTDLAKILSRIRKLLSVARARGKEGKIKEQKREEQRRAWKGTVSRLQDKENDKDTESVQTHNFRWAARDVRRVRVTTSRRTRSSHSDWNTKNELFYCRSPDLRNSSSPPSVFLFLFSLKEIRSV